MNKTTLSIATLIVIYFVLQKMTVFFHIRLGFFSFLLLIGIAITALYFVLNSFSGSRS